MIDMDRVLTLLNVVEKVSLVAPGYTPITGEAMAELREISETIRKEKEAQQGLPVTPAPVGDTDSPAPNVGAAGDVPELEMHPTASAPIESAVDTKGSALEAAVDPTTGSTPLPLERKI